MRATSRRIRTCDRCQEPPRGSSGYSRCTQRFFERREFDRSAGFERFVVALAGDDVREPRRRTRRFVPRGRNDGGLRANDFLAIGSVPTRFGRAGTTARTIEEPLRSFGQCHHSWREESPRVDDAFRVEGSPSGAAKRSRNLGSSAGGRVVSLQAKQVTTMDRSSWCDASPRSSWLHESCAPCRPRTVGTGALSLDEMACFVRVNGGTDAS